MKLVRSDERPTNGAVDQGGGLWLVADCDVLTAGAVALTDAETKDFIKPRTDLPDGHPLVGKRALRAVPAGTPDIIVDDQGHLVAVADGEPVVDREGEIDDHP